MWRYDERAPNAEQRAAIKESLPALNQAAAEAKAALDARRAELLRDPLYQQLLAAKNAAELARANALSAAHHYRVTVGRDTGFAFHVVAQADNWQDAIDKLKATEVQS